jgi:hypothetical protein
MMNLDLFELVIVVAVFVLAGVVKGVIGLGLPTDSRAWKHCLDIHYLTDVPVATH